MAPFTAWHQSRGNAGRQLGTSARLCPPPARPTSERGEESAVPKKPLQDGALEILSTNYESGDKQGICKSISDRTFPGKSFIQAWLQTGPHAGSSCPSPCLCPGTEAGVRPPCSASPCKPDSAIGLSGHENWRARLHSVGVSWRSLQDCHQENSHQEPCLSSTCKRTWQLLTGSAEETAGLDGVAWVGGQKTRSHCERARGICFPENTEKPGKEGTKKRDKCSRHLSSSLGGR